MFITIISKQSTTMMYIIVLAPIQIFLVWIFFFKNQRTNRAQKSGKNTKQGTTSFSFHSYSSLIINYYAYQRHNILRMTNEVPSYNMFSCTKYNEFHIRFLTSKLREKGNEWYDYFFHLTSYFKTFSTIGGLPI